jgi:hypothetical protein
MITAVVIGDLASKSFYGIPQRCSALRLRSGKALQQMLPVKEVKTWQLHVEVGQVVVSASVPRPMLKVHLETGTTQLASLNLAF